jgi:hypothetical protein
MNSQSTKKIGINTKSSGKRKNEISNGARWDNQEGEGTPSPYAPFLLIPYADTDVGARPIEDYQNVKFWESPAIFVETPDPRNPDNPLPGVPTHVHARVSNLGRQRIAPVVVTFWWCNPAMGISPEQMRFIGSEIAPSIAPGETVDVRCSKQWIPNSENNGHDCLMVNCTGKILDVLPKANEFHPIIDRRVGQRNCFYIESPINSTTPFRLELANFLPLHAQTLVLSQTKRVQLKSQVIEKLTHRDLMQTVQSASVKNGDVSRERRSSYEPVSASYVPTSIRSSLSEPIGGVEGGFERSILANLLLASERAVNRHPMSSEIGTSTLHQTLMAPFELRRLEMELIAPPFSVPGDFIVYRLSQATQGMLLGGYTVVMRVTE